MGGFSREGSSPFFGTVSPEVLMVSGFSCLYLLDVGNLWVTIKSYKVDVGHLGWVRNLFSRPEQSLYSLQSVDQMREYQLLLAGSLVTGEHTSR